MSRWRLITLGILKYRTFTDLVNHVVSWPPPASALLDVLATESNSKDTAWARADDTQRFGVPIVWPGFDDSGVAGWASRT